MRNAVILCFLCASIAAAQPAATTPADRELIQLRAEVARLRAENAQLRQAIARLKIQRSAATTRPIVTSGNPDDVAKAIRKGMAAADADAMLRKAMAHGLVLITEETDNDGALVHRYGYQADGRTVHLTVSYKDGVVTSVDRHTEY